MSELDRLAREHLAEMHDKLSAKGFAGRVGFGERPAVLVLNLSRPCGYLDRFPSSRRKPCSGLVSGG